MTRRELIDRTKQLVAEGDRLVANPSLDGLRTWLQLSDDLLSAAWGRMDRYHLAWLQVGRPTNIVRGRAMTEVEADAYVREVAAAKIAVLRMSAEAVERRGMPFVGETRE
jgi:putative heme degradation protein